VVAVVVGDARHEGNSKLLGSGVKLLRIIAMKGGDGA